MLDNSELVITIYNNKLYKIYKFNNNFIYFIYFIYFIIYDKLYIISLFFGL